MKYRRSIALMSALLLMVVGAGVAHADNLQADGDGLVTSGSSTSIDFGTICDDAGDGEGVSIAVKRVGNGNVYKGGSSVSFSIHSVSGGVTASAPTPATITLPANWASTTTPSPENNNMSGAAASDVSLAAGSTGGTVTFKATGTDTNDETLVLTKTVSVSATLSNSWEEDGCGEDPNSGGGDPDITPPTIDCGAADGNWHAGDVEITCTASDASGLADEDQASFSLWTNVAEGTEDDDASTDSVEVCDTEGNCADAGPVGGNKVDKKAPAITVNSPAGSYLLNEVVLADYSCSDGGSDVATCAGADDLGSVEDGAAVYTGTVGGKGFSVSATDNVGNTATWPEAAAASGHEYTVAYATGGSCLGSPGHSILQPIDRDGSSVFKLGSTVPAKFRVCDANGVSVGTPGVVTSFVQTGSEGGINASVDEAVVSTTPDLAFRWSPDGQQWIYNIGTKGKVGSTKYFYKITLNDDSTITFAFTLKK